MPTHVTNICSFSQSTEVLIGAFITTRMGQCNSFLNISAVFFIPKLQRIKIARDWFLITLASDKKKNGV